MGINIVQKIDDLVPIRNVLVSVSNKKGLEGFIPGLLSIVPDVRIYSTGGTYAEIEKLLGREAAAGHLMQVSDYTKQPEVQGGLVKTLDFKIYLGLLTEKYNESHQADLRRTGAVAIDMVVVNLYPFKETAARAGVTVEECRANIDIGGPCMIRAAAKNYLRVAVVVDPEDYPGVLDKMGKLKGRLDVATRFTLAKKAFEYTAQYDAAIAAYLADRTVESMRSCYRFMDGAH